MLGLGCGRVDVLSGGKKQPGEIPCLCRGVADSSNLTKHAGGGRMGRDMSLRYTLYPRPNRRANAVSGPTAATPAGPLVGGGLRVVAHSTVMLRGDGCLFCSCSEVVRAVPEHSPRSGQHFEAKSAVKRFERLSSSWVRAGWRKSRRGFTSGCLSCTVAVLGGRGYLRTRYDDGDSNGTVVLSTGASAVPGNGTARPSVSGTLAYTHPAVGHSSPRNHRIAATSTTTGRSRAVGEANHCIVD